MACWKKLVLGVSWAPERARRGEGRPDQRPAAHSHTFTQMAEGQRKHQAVEMVEIKEGNKVTYAFWSSTYCDKNIMYDQCG